MSSLTLLIICHVVGFHVDDKRPITFATVYHWLQAVNEMLIRGHGGNQSAFHLFPVVIEPAFVYRYTVHIAGNAVPWDSQDFIVPGNYGLFSKG